MSAPVIVGASAGSGKTYRLTQEVTRALSSRIARLDGLVAVTYTRKAEAELASRIRRALIASGAFDAAARLPVAYLGTVHAVCMRLLEELALDAGVSPYPEVLADDGGRRLREAIEGSLPAPMLERLGAVARRLQILHDERTRRQDWLRRVFEIMELARGNRIAPQALPAMGRRSLAGLLNQLGPVGDGAALDEAFDDALRLADEALAAGDDETQATADVHRRVSEIRERRRRGELLWCDWARASMASPGKKSRDAVAPLIAAASACDRHPALHDDLCTFTLGVFEAASLALTGYASWKAERRVVDYTDMIDQALRLVEDEAVAHELATRLDLVVVDEMQDTSPLQLALFTRLHRLAGRSVWVGDGKQCIFEYAGADPLLMDSVVGWCGRQGGAPERLERNYRSRPELVDACSALFARAFAPLGTVPASVQTTAARIALPELADLPPLGVWWLEGKTADDQAEAIAEGVRRLLAPTSDVRVLDREHGVVRPVKARDVGVLTATNAEARRLASALLRRGVRASLPRDGLLQRPEGVLVDAALRWLLAPTDGAARATLEALNGWNGGDPDGWLEARLRGDGREAPRWLDGLAALRRQLDALSPAETLDRVLRLVDAPTLCARWPDPRQRLGNLEALRALAARYEDRCLRLREPATVAGLVRYFEEAQRTVLVGDEEQATDDQFAGADGDDAVTVSTYHRAKGLEWPVVVLTSLDRKGKRDACDPSPETDRQDFDPDDPLGGRWIRFWPWPFGRTEKVPLAEAIDASPEGRRVAERERKERVRLLYVGFTRARDHLVLAVKAAKKGASAAWLDELRDGDGDGLVDLPLEAEDDAVSVATLAGRRVACLVLRPDSTVSTAATEAPRPRFARPAAVPPERPRYRITPSQRGPDTRPVGRPLVVDRVLSLGAPFVARGRADWNTVGDAVHAFLAADQPGSLARRRARAGRHLAVAGMTGVLDAAALVGMADRLQAYVDARWPDATWQREVPVTAYLDTPDGARRIEGVIDLLLRLPDGVVLVDHKTFPVPSLNAVATKAAALTSQLAIYAEALTRCGERVHGAHLHFPLAGAWVDLRPA